MTANVPRSLSHLALLAFLLAGCASSQYAHVEDAAASRPPLSEPKGAQLVSVINQDCKVWSSEPKQQHSFRWTGPCVGGKAHGRGTLAFHHEFKLKAIEAGQFSSPARIERSEHFYDGELENGWMQGDGTLRFISPKLEAVTRGRFRRNKLHGQAVTQSSSTDSKLNSTTKIEYWDGIPHGRYVETFPQFSYSKVKLREGEYRNGVLVGRWTGVDWSGRQVSGPYRDGFLPVYDSDDRSAGSSEGIGTAFLEGLSDFAEGALAGATALSQAGQAYTQSNAYRQGEALRQAEAAASSQRMLDSICVTNCSNSSTIKAPSALSPTPRLEAPGIDLDKYDTVAPSVNIEVQPPERSVFTNRRLQQYRNQYKTVAPPLNCQPHTCSDGSVLNRKAQRRDGTWFCNYELVCAR